MAKEMKHPAAYNLTRWEFNVLALESLLLGSGLSAGLAKIASQRLASLFSVEVARGIGLGVGSFVLMLCLFAVLSIHARNVRGRRLSFAKMLAGALVGCTVGGMIYAVIQ
ncbi:MAG: hypothetical protein ACRDHY_13815 [Anaerolineales bacterium]